MKKNIYFALFFLIICFLAGGFYISKSINKVTDKLETIITLNKVEFLRETLLSKITVVQGDLLLMNTVHARNVNIFIQHVEEMHQVANHCQECHHDEKTKKSINQFVAMIDSYLKKLSRVYTLRANEQRLNQEKQEALDLGNATLGVVKRVVITSQHKTSERVQQARNTIQDTRIFLFILMTLGPVIIIFATFHFFKIFTGSVLTLTNATRKIKKGDLSYRIEEHLKDEFLELANSFNEMASSLKQQQLKVRQTERLAAVGELAAGLAHEIKNPLAGIKVSIEVLKNDLDLQQEDKEIFLRIINEIYRIESLLKDLLNYARPSTPHPHFVTLHEILDVIINDSELLIQSPSTTSGLIKDIKFVKEYDAHISTIFADSGQLKQVFLNLMLNSIDAITDKGTISIKTAKVSDDSIEVRVSDTGKGIDQHDIKLVFNPFFTTKSKGTGLGLAICKRLIEQHKGSIDVFNNPESGVTFVITLPENMKKTV